MERKLTEVAPLQATTKDGIPFKFYASGARGHGTLRSVKGEAYRALVRELGGAPSGRQLKKLRRAQRQKESCTVVVKR